MNLSANRSLPVSRSFSATCARVHGFPPCRMTLPLLKLQERFGPPHRLFHRQNASANFKHTISHHWGTSPAVPARKIDPAARAVFFASFRFRPKSELGLHSGEWSLIIGRQNGRPPQACCEIPARPHHALGDQPLSTSGNSLAAVPATIFSKARNHIFWNWILCCNSSLDLTPALFRTLGGRSPNAPGTVGRLSCRLAFGRPSPRPMSSNFSFQNSGRFQLAARHACEF